VADWIDLIDPAEAELENALPHEIHERALARLSSPHDTTTSLARASRAMIATSSASS
jgi:hypothetical protein